MKINSLSHKTDLIVSKLDAVVTKKDNYTVIKTPSQPNYFWGNYIIFNNAPKEGDYKKWYEIYGNEFDINQGFIAISWDEKEKGYVNEFLENEFRFEVCNVLTSSEVNLPPKYNKDIIIRELSSEEDWNQYCEVHLNNDWYLSLSSQKDFINNQIPACKKMVENGLGKRFGAFLDKKLVGELGIYYENGIGRYNQVSTHQNYRRLGICGTLVYESAKIAFNEWNVSTLVMIAVAEDHPEKIYKSVGFKETEKQYSLEWVDKTKF